MPLSRRIVAAIAGGMAAMMTLSACSDNPAPSFTPPPQVDGALPAEAVEQMEAAVTHAIETIGASGAIVGVWAPWAGSWVTGIGTQGDSAGTPVTAENSFRIADVTRLMTCDVLYALDAQRVVSKDAPVSNYVSGVPDLSDVTLLDLCNNTAGIGQFYATVDSIVLENPEREWGPMELAAYGVGKPRSQTKTRYRNSDAAYLLLGLALERASGKSASELIQEYIAEPLELQNTELPRPAAAMPAGDPLRGYYLPQDGDSVDCSAPVDITRMSSSIGYTDSGVTSTIEDLGRYVRATASQALLGGEDSTRWENPLPVSDSTPTWRQTTGGARLDGPLIGQYGAVPGYATAAYSDPGTGFTVAVVLNNASTTNSTVMYLAWQLAAIASKVPAAEGEAAPEFALPFTAEEYGERISSMAICSAPSSD